MLVHLRTAINCCLLLVLLLLPLPGLAQGVATVLGTVTDQSGGVVPGCKVVLENLETGVSATTQTDGNGLYRFLEVRIGRYRVVTEVLGFKSVTTDAFILTVDARQRVDLTLQVGATTQTVEVTGAAAALETDSSNRGQLILHDAVVDLPLNGRSYADLSLLSPGVRQSVLGNMAKREASYNVNGQRAAYNNFILDGVDNNAYGTANQGFSNQVIQAAPDAVQEIRVDTNNYSAEYGRAGGAVINAVVRSGTNVFHGSAWDFLRNTVLNATGFFQPLGRVKPPLIQNQFGATFGGPILKNKMFFFADYEGVRSVSRTLSYLTLPTQAQRAGNFGIPILNPYTGVTYSNGVIPASAITAFGQKVLNDLPPLNLPGTSNNLQAFPRTRDQIDKGDIRIDYHLSDKLTLFGRYSHRLSTSDAESALPGPSGMGNVTKRAYNQQIAVGATWIMSPRSLLDVRFGMTRTQGEDVREREIDDTPSILAMYGITGLPDSKPIAGGINRQAVNGFSNFGRDSGQHQFPNVINPKLSFSQTAGRHTIKAGFEYQAINTELVDFNPLYGADTYAGQFSRPKGASSNSVYNMADFLFGARASYQLTSPDSPGVLQYRQRMYFAYVQDDFKATQRLTLNLGLRWEYGTPPWDSNNHLSNFDPATNSLILAKDGSMYDRSLVNPSRLNFAPRFGAAFNLTPKTVIRGGYGISYVHFQRAGNTNLLGYNGPYVVSVTANQLPSQGVCVSPDSPWRTCFRPTPMGYPANFAVPANFNQAGTSIRFLPKDSPTTYVQTWYLSVQRQITRDLVLDLAYVGNRGVHIQVLTDYNQAYPNLPGQNVVVDARRPLANFGVIQEVIAFGTSSYHAMQVKLEKRLSGGLYFLNSFTWSKTIDNAGGNMETGSGDYYYINNFDFASSKGLSGFNQPFSNVTTVTWNLPLGQNRRFASGVPAWANVVIGNWRITGINTMSSGLPVNLYYSPSAAFSVGSPASPCNFCRPNITGDPMQPADQRTIDSYFNKANLSLPTDVSHPFGNAGRNIATGWPLYRLDVSVQKNFPLRAEGRRLEFRAEFFNALNKTNFQPPASDLANSAFGTTRSTFAARQIQMALKFVF